MFTIATVASGPASDTIIVLSLLFPSVALGIWAFVDVIRKSDEAFAAIGRSRKVWISIFVALGAATFFALLSFLGTLTVSAFYLIRVRPLLNRNHTSGIASPGS